MLNMTTTATVDTDRAPACALCEVNPGIWTAGGRWFCAKCEGVFGLDGALARMRLADPGAIGGRRDRWHDDGV